MHWTNSREQLLHKVVEVAPERQHLNRSQSSRNRKQVFIPNGEKAGTSGEKSQKIIRDISRILEY